MWMATGRIMSRVTRMLSGKIVFTAVFGLCALGILASTYFMDISFAWNVNTDIAIGAPRVLDNNDFNTGTTSQIVFSRPTDMEPVDDDGDDDGDDFCQTTMTFNTTLVVRCKESPFIECRPSSKLNVTNNKFWKVLYLRRPFWLPVDWFDVSACPFNQCRIDETTNENEADLIFVYGVGLHEKLHPPRQIKDKLYAIGLWEPPPYSISHFAMDNSSVWNSVFNIILTYRVDADIFSPYNKLTFRPRPVKERPDYYAIAQKKTRTALWFVSHCKTESKRDDYVAEMQKYVDVDIFGKCGKKCSGVECDFGNLFSMYKFYLAFENSLCTDYVTEKFFKLFQPETYVIPVVRGGTNYDKYFANFTYINAAHFTTAKDLALYLKHLASDLETYSKYLEYKDLYVKQDGLIKHTCSICEYLHTHTFSQTKYYNLKSWLVDGQCFNATDNKNNYM